MSRTTIAILPLLSGLMLWGCAHGVASGDPEARTERTVVRSDSMQEPDPAKFLTTLPWPSMQAVTAVMEAHRSHVASCVMQAESEELPLFGHYSVRFLIAEDGFIRRAEVARSNLRDSAVEACVLGVVRSVRFPNVPLRGGLDARHVFLSMPTKAYVKAKSKSVDGQVAAFSPVPG